MRIHRVLLVMIIIATSCASAEPSFRDHQIYDGGKEDAIKASQMALADIGLEVLGVDPIAGIVVSKAREVGESEKTVTEGFDETGHLIYILIVFISLTESENVDIDVTMIIHAQWSREGWLKERGILDGNIVTQRFYDALDRYMGKGYLSD